MSNGTLALDWLSIQGILGRRDQLLTAARAELERAADTACAEQWRTGPVAELLTESAHQSRGKGMARKLPIITEEPRARDMFKCSWQRLHWK